MLNRMILTTFLQAFLRWYLPVLSNNHFIWMHFNLTIQGYSMQSVHFNLRKSVSQPTCFFGFSANRSRVRKTSNWRFLATGPRKFFFRTGKFEESSKAASTTQQPRKDGRSKKKCPQVPNYLKFRDFKFLDFFLAI